MSTSICSQRQIFWIPDKICPLLSSCPSCCSPYVFLIALTCLSFPGPVRHNFASEAFLCVEKHTGTQTRNLVVIIVHVICYSSTKELRHLFIFIITALPKLLHPCKPVQGVVKIDWLMRHLASSHPFSSGVAVCFGTLRVPSVSGFSLSKGLCFCRL